MNKTILKIGLWVTAIILLSVLWNLVVSWDIPGKLATRDDPAFPTQLFLKMENNPGVYVEDGALEYQVSKVGNTVMCTAYGNRGMWWWQEGFQDNLTFDLTTHKGDWLSLRGGEPPEEGKVIVIPNKFGIYEVTFIKSSGKVRKGILQPRRL